MINPTVFVLMTFGGTSAHTADDAIASLVSVHMTLHGAMTAANSDDAIDQYLAASGKLEWKADVYGPRCERVWVAPIVDGIGYAIREIGAES